MVGGPQRMHVDQRGCENSNFMKPQWDREYFTANGHLTPSSGGTLHEERDQKETRFRTFNRYIYHVY